MAVMGRQEWRRQAVGVSSRRWFSDDQAKKDEAQPVRLWLGLMRCCLAQQTLTHGVLSDALWGMQKAEEAKEGGEKAEVDEKAKLVEKLTVREGHTYRPGRGGRQEGHVRE